MQQHEGSWTHFTPTVKPITDKMATMRHIPELSDLSN